MSFQVANSLQAGSLGLALEASRSVFDVAFPLFAVQVLHSRSTLFFAAMHVGSGLGMIAVSEKKVSAWIENLLSASFFVMGASHLFLGLSPPSFTFFLLIAGAIGLATSVASISSSVRIQTLSRDKPERSYLNAVYRVMGIITRIVTPLLIGNALDITENSEQQLVQSRHTVLLLTLGVVLCVMAAILFNFVRASPHERGNSDEDQRGGQKQLSGADSANWHQIIAYCFSASLPNMAGGLIRSLLLQFLTDKLKAGPNFFSATHAAAQFTSVFFTIITSRVLRHGGRSFLLRTLAIQSFAMTVAAFALGSCTSSASAAVTFVLMRAIEESCKLPNSLLLHELCSGHPSTATPSTNKALLVRAIALQKGIGAALKVCVSLLSAVSMHHLGVEVTIYFAACICLGGSASLAYTYYKNQNHHHNS